MQRNGYVVKFVACGICSCIVGYQPCTSAITVREGTNGDGKGARTMPLPSVTDSCTRFHHGRGLLRRLIARKSVRFLPVA